MQTRRKSRLRVIGRGRNSPRWIHQGRQGRPTYPSLACIGTPRYSGGATAHDGRHWVSGRGRVEFFEHLIVQFFGWKTLYSVFEGGQLLPLAWLPCYKGFPGLQAGGSFNDGGRGWFAAETAIGSANCSFVSSHVSFITHWRATADDDMD